MYFLSDPAVSSFIFVGDKWEILIRTLQLQTVSTCRVSSVQCWICGTLNTRVYAQPIRTLTLFYYYGKSRAACAAHVRLDSYPNLFSFFAIFNTLAPPVCEYQGKNVALNKPTSQSSSYNFRGKPLASGNANDGMSCKRALSIHGTRLPVTLLTNWCLFHINSQCTTWSRKPAVDHGPRTPTEKLKLVSFICWEKCKSASTGWVGGFGAGVGGGVGGGGWGRAREGKLLLMHMPCSLWSLAHVVQWI